MPIVSLAATGVQIYACTEADGALAWGKPEPDAELFRAGRRPVGRHLKGPAWEARDGSRVVGSVIDQAPAPRPGAVAWLLLSAQATGPGLLAGTRYVLRRDTVGGVKPARACAAVGETVRVPYTATYRFYR